MISLVKNDILFVIVFLTNISTFIGSNYNFPIFILKSSEMVKTYRRMLYKKHDTIKGVGKDAR